MIYCLHDLLLCPIFLHFPQRLLLLDGGAAVAGENDWAVVVDSAERNGDNSCGGDTILAGEGDRTGVEFLLPTLGTCGRGQVTSLSPSGQNGLMELYKYHCRSDEKCFGGTIAGRSSH